MIAPSFVGTILYMNKEVKQGNSLKFRMDDITLGLHERARGYIDLNKSKFIPQSIRGKAEAVIAEHEKTRFNKQDWEMFFELVDNTVPTPRMKKALKNIMRLL
jgi:uncharacterized protein (DUF1778 family)